MNTHDCLAQIFQRFNQSSWALSGGKRLTPKNVCFIYDAAVQYPVGNRSSSSRPSQCGVWQEDLVAPEQFAQAFNEMLTGGPNWIHANLIPFGENQFLITLCAGRKVGSSRSSINISYEPNKTVEIVSLKTLVTTN